jgi:hypothetical protein
VKVKDEGMDMGDGGERMMNDDMSPCSLPLIEIIVIVISCYVV